MHQRRRFFAYAMGLGMMSHGSVASGAGRPVQTLRFAFSRPQHDPRTQWLIAVFTEVLQRIGLGFEFVDVPAGRATLMVLAGQVDGELGRTYDYLELHPQLVRVPEPNNRVEFAMYASKPEIAFNSWAEVKAQGWRCECRRGIQELERLLQIHLQPDRVSVIASIEQGLRRLQLDRTDAYFDVREAVSDFYRFAKASAPEQAGPVLREVAIIKATTGHAYLNTAHAGLAEAMAQTLRQLKKEGRVQSLLEQALKNADAPPDADVPGHSRPNLLRPTES